MKTLFLRLHPGSPGRTGGERADRSRAQRAGRGAPRPGTGPRPSPRRPQGPSDGCDQGPPERKAYPQDAFGCKKQSPPLKLPLTRRTFIIEVASPEVGWASELVDSAAQRSSEGPPSFLPICPPCQRVLRVVPRAGWVQGHLHTPPHQQPGLSAFFWARGHQASPRSPSPHTSLAGVNQRQGRSFFLDLQKGGAHRCAQGWVGSWSGGGGCAPEGEEDSAGWGGRPGAQVVRLPMETPRKHFR